MPRTMFPAPITSAISRPPLWASTISWARPSIVSGSTPWSRSPISASPESFRRTRPNGAVLGSGVGALVTCLLCQCEAAELKHLEPGLLERCADLLAGLVDPLLAFEHEVGEPLLDPALDDLAAHVLRLRLEVGLLQQDLALGVDLRFGHLGPCLVERRGERDVHRQRPGGLGVALAVDQHPDLLRGRVNVAGEDLALLRLEPSRVAHDDVLPQL